MESLILPKNEPNSHRILSWVCLVRFLKEYGTSWFAFEIYWPLEMWSCVYWMVLHSNRFCLFGYNWYSQFRYSSYNQVMLPTLKSWFLAEIGLKNHILQFGISGDLSEHYSGQKKEAYLVWHYFHTLESDRCSPLNKCSPWKMRMK